MSIARTSRPIETHAEQRRVEWGDRVRVDFMAWLEDGSVFDSSLYDEPRVFVVGAQSVVPGINHLVIGMTVGESKTQRLPSDLAFGPYHTDLGCRVNRGWLRAQRIVPVVGLGLAIHNKDGTRAQMSITELNGEQDTLDANHRLAGKSIVVQLDLLEIIDPVAPEIPGACPRRL